jgi:hypothetical protein
MLIVFVDSIAIVFYDGGKQEYLNIRGIVIFIVTVRMTGIELPLYVAFDIILKNSFCINRICFEI